MFIIDIYFFVKLEIKKKNNIDPFGKPDILEIFDSYSLNRTVALEFLKI